MTPEDNDFFSLVRIVGEVYRINPHELVGSRKHRHAEARALVGTVWSEMHTMEETAKRLLRNSPGAVFSWQSRIHKILQTNHPSTGRINEVTRRVAEEIPHVVGIYPEGTEIPQEQTK